MIPKVYKRLPPEDYSINGVPVLKSHKEINPTVNRGIYQTNLTPVGDIAADNDPINDSGIYQSVHWHSIKHQYYRLPKWEPIERLPRATPDLRCRFLTPFGGIINLGQTKDCTIRLLEVKYAETYGPISILIPAVPGFAFSYDGSRTSAINPVTSTGNLTDGWYATFGLDGSLTLTTEKTIPPGVEFKVTFCITATNAPVNNTLNILLMPGSGGDSDAVNNSAQIGLASLP